MNRLAVRFLVSLVLTLLIETPLSLLFKARGKELLLVALVNVLTNPAVVLLSAVMGDSLQIQIFPEILVILIEGYYYKKYGSYIEHPFLCALCCNSVSYGFGIILKIFL